MRCGDRGNATRATGVRELLDHYGFASSSGLNSQSVPATAMEEQVKIFAPTWFTVKAAKAFAQLDFGEVRDLALRPNAAQRQELDTVSEQMTALFLDWLEELATELGVRL